MTESFEVDPYPGAPKILFIGLAESSHTHAWIDLLEGAKFNVRLFAMPTAPPPDDWPVRTYVTIYGGPSLNGVTRARLFPTGQLQWLGQRIAARITGTRTVHDLAAKWLAKIVREWQPHIIHTLGLDPASYFFADARSAFGLQNHAKWVTQVRGGPDLALHHLLPDHLTKIKTILKGCDQLIADNEQNYQLALQLGGRKEQLSTLGVVPGTGGIEIDRVAARSSRPASKRHVILWPKAYDCEQSKALPVIEALKLAWKDLPACEVHVLAATPETQMWLQTLPDEMRQSFHVSDRVARSRVLELMSEARVMLAPTLADGIPNSLFEAMAAGAFPIVSPLETLVPIFHSERNVLFARNLYPHEIADALRRAMTDDKLVDEAAEQNLNLVRTLADRDRIRQRVIEFYEELAMIP